MGFMIDARLPGAVLVAATMLGGLPGLAATAAAQQPAATLEVAHSDRYGAYLTDGRGRPLYGFSADPRGGSACYADCARIWPPAILAGEPTITDPAVDAGRVGTIVRSDGSRQLTYAGHPLYRYLDDRGGEPHGQRVAQFGGDWQLISPGGRPIGP